MIAIRSHLVLLQTVGAWTSLHLWNGRVSRWSPCHVYVMVIQISYSAINAGNDTYSAFLSAAKSSSGNPGVSNGQCFLYCYRLNLYSYYSKAKVVLRVKVHQHQLHPALSQVEPLVILSQLVQRLLPLCLAVHPAVQPAAVAPVLLRHRLRTGSLCCW